MHLRHSLRSIGPAVLLWMVPFAAHAQQAANMQQMIAVWVTWAITVMNVGIWIIFTMLTQLLDTSVFLDAPMLAVLNEVWQLARDLVNIAFAVILIGAAVYTVVTAKREFISEHLKKFVLAVILVNFSWFIPRVIIDVGNIAAATIYDIPSMIGGQAATCTYRSNMQINLQGAPNPACSNIPGTNPQQFNCPCAAVLEAKFFVTNQVANTLLPADGWNRILGNTLYVRLADMASLQNAAPSYVVLNGLIINHARLVGLASVPPAVQQNQVAALIIFLLQEAIVLLIHAALFFPLAAMLLAFAIRIPVLWLTIAFMPFMVLKFVVPEQFTGEYPQKIWDNFLKAAFLPAIVGVPLTVGFIMVNAGQSTGLLSNLQGVAIPLTGSISNYQQLMWLLMVLGIIWVGVFSMLEKMGVMGMGSQMIKGTGEMIGKTALKAPLSVPLIPGTNFSLLGMARAPRRLSSAFDNNDTFSEAMDDLRRGGAPNKIKQSAQQNAGDKQKLKELDTDIKALTQAIKDGKDAERNAALQKISTDFNAPITNSNDLGRLIDELKATGSADNQTMIELETSRRALEAQERAGRPQNP